MDNIKIIPEEGEEISFSFTIPEQYHVLNINVHDPDYDDILLHIDFRYTENKIILNNRIDQSWGEEIHHEFSYATRQNKGVITFTDRSFRFRIAEIECEVPSARPYTGRLIRLYSDFRFVSLDTFDFQDEIYSLRWPLLERQAPKVSNSRLANQVPTHLKGNTGLVLFDGNIKDLERFCSGISNSFDQILIVIHDAKNIDLTSLRNIQSRYYSIEIIIADRLFSNGMMTSKLKDSLFINYALSYANYKNAVLLVPDCDHIDSITNLVKNFRLRSRTDNFCVFANSDSGAGLTAFSLDKYTTFESSSDGAFLSAASLLGRSILATKTVLYDASACWSIDNTRMLRNEGTSPVEAICVNENTGVDFVLPRRGKLMVLIVSCKKNRDKQDLIRETWAKDLSEAGIEYKFIEGDPSLNDPIMFDDRLLVSTPDTYEYLSHKIWRALNAAYQIDEINHILKIDDDCVCNVEKLLEFRHEQYDYMGTDISIGGQSFIDWHFGSTSNKQISNLIFEIEDNVTWYDGQGGYFLSKNAADKILNLDIEDFQHILEDYAVGRELQKHGIKARKTVSSFQALRFSYIANDRDYEKTIISDVPNTDEMRAVYQRFCDLNRELRKTNSNLKISIKDSGAA